MGFATHRNQMNDDLFEEHGELSEWSNVSDQVLVIHREQDEDVRLGSAWQKRRSHILRVRACDVAAPRKGDRVVVGEEGSFEVIAEPQLVRNHVWRCEAKTVW